MRTRLVEERIGENLGPIDWSYDFTQHDWGGGRGGVNPAVSARGVDLLRQIETALASGVRLEAMIYQNYHDVIAIGMYDGWPFWKPTPSVLLSGTLGSEWHPWYSIQRVDPR